MGLGLQVIVWFCFSPPAATYSGYSDHNLSPFPQLDQLIIFLHFAAKMSLASFWLFGFRLWVRCLFHCSMALPISYISELLIVAGRDQCPSFFHQRT
ncbi:hypothetical protein NPIL_268041 [Nephila pilipes]|uniref:Uncharacterized protein n=1 Tax=Nephila pilipes TaxID=299642 RepID=A0A8X6QYV2_NEPPI|nr:hypothetical protein NPIL_268041 [Nephila pilipes]